LSDSNTLWLQVPQQ